MSDSYYQSGYTGQQIDNAIGRIVSGELDKLVDSATDAAASAQGILSGVQDAVENIPSGSTPIVNDLTTGGTKMALSAEMGKNLDSRKLNADGSNNMTGNLVISTESYPTAYLKDKNLGREARIIKKSSTEVQDLLDNNNYSALSLSPETTSEANLLRLLTKKNGGDAVTRQILHTGNKPSGSYTGNGDATNRTIETGGIGSVVAIMGPHGICIASAAGAIGAIGGNTPVGFGAGTARFASGALIIASAHELFNVSGATYYYQVL